MISMPGNIRSRFDKLFISLTFVAIALTILAHVWMAYTLSSFNRPLRENFSDDMFRVLHLSPVHSLHIIHDPSHLSLSPAAFEPLEKFSDAGISVRRDKIQNRTNSALFTEDALRLSMLLENEGNIYKALSILPLPENEQFFVILGNMASTSRGEEGEEEDIYTFQDFLNRHSSDSPEKRGKKQFVYKDDADIRLISAVLLASGATDPKNIVDNLIRPYSKTVGNPVDVISDERPTVIFTTLSRSSAAWSKLRNTKLIWFSYMEVPGGGKIDLPRLKHVLPYVHEIHLNVQMDVGDMEEIQGERSIISHIAFPAFIAGHVSLEHNPMLATCSIALLYPDEGSPSDINVKDIAPMNNLMARFFPYFTTTLNVLSYFNRRIHRKYISSGTDGNEFYFGGFSRDTALGRKRGLRLGRPRLNILEQFQQDEEVESSKLASKSITIISDVDVQVDDGETMASVTYMFDRKIRMLEIRSASALLATIRNVPVRIWDRVELSNQNDEHMNGKFYVTKVLIDQDNPKPKTVVTLTDALILQFREGRDKIEEKARSQSGVDRIVLINGGEEWDERDKDNEYEGLPWISDRQTVKKPWRLNAKKDIRFGDMLCQITGADRVFFVNLGEKGLFASVVDDAYDEQLAFLLEEPLDIEEEEWNDDAYSCIGDDRVKNPAQCKALRDKGHGVVWDRPCRKHDECPFFQANNLYPNYRGGCMESGFCEVPLGVQRMGYRKYDESRSNPLCHSCVDPLDRDCCQKQGDRPDFAFVADETDRMNTVDLND